MSKTKSSSKTSISVKVPKMNDNLYKVYELELEARQVKVKDILRFQRERGKVIFRVKCGLSLDGKKEVDYGEAAVELLADSLGIHRSYAYKLSSFYEIYSDNDKFQELMDKFEDNNFTLSWSHFNFLVHAEEEVREELIDEVISKKLSVRALQKLLSDKKIEISEDSEVVADGIVDSVPTKETVSTQAAETVAASMPDVDEEEQVETPEPARSETDSHVDVSVPSAKTVLKNLVTSSGKFGDKLIDLVGDLTISLNGVHGSVAHKDIFKGLSSASEVLRSLKQQIEEYQDQIDSIRARLTAQKSEESE